MNDKLKNDNVNNTNDNLEDLSSQEANVETIEKKDEVESLSERKKSIKDYLSKDLFADVKRISFNDDKPSEDKKENLLSEEYQGTFNDISENQIISAKVIGISDSDVMVDIGFKSEGLINRSEFNSKDLPEIGSNIDILLEKFEDTDGNITLSKYKADFIKRSEELQRKIDIEKNKTESVGDLNDFAFLKKADEPTNAST